MVDFLKKFLSAFSYGAGFILAIVCVVYATSQFTKSGVNVTSSTSSSVKTSRDNLSAIEVKDVSKLSNFTNYSGEGRKEVFIFTGQLVNNSSDILFERLMVEVDLYDSEDKFIYKCGGWDGSGLQLPPQSNATFQRTCHNMPSEIASRYKNHKVVVSQRRF